MARPRIGGGSDGNRAELDRPAPSRPGGPEQRPSRSSRRLRRAAAAAALKIPTRNRPNTPVRHMLKQRVVPTVPSFAANLRGGVAVAGNTLETCPENQPGNEVCAGNTDNKMNRTWSTRTSIPATGALQLQQRQPDDPRRRTRRQGVPALGGRPVAGRRQRSGQPNRQRRAGWRHAGGPAAAHSGQAPPDQFDVRDREASRRHRVHVHNDQRVHTGLGPGEMGFGQQLVLDGADRGFPEVAPPAGPTRSAPTSPTN